MYLFALLTKDTFHSQSSKLNSGKTLTCSNIPPGVRIGSIIQNVVGLGVGIGIAFYASWRLSLLTLACIPFVAAAG